MNERRKWAIYSVMYVLLTFLYIGLLVHRWRCFDVSIRHFLDMPLGQALSLAFFTLALLFVGTMAILYGARATEEKT